MTHQKKQEFDNMLSTIILTCRALENKAQQAFDMLAGSGKPASARKGKVNAAEIIAKRRVKLYTNVTKN